jgi:uncharacterized protein YigE (DUF2233 family)
MRYKTIFCLMLIAFFDLQGFAYGGEFSCTPLTKVQWETIGEGVQWAKFDLSFTPYLKTEHAWSLEKSRQVTVRAFKVDYSRNRLLFHRSEKDLGCDPLRERYIEKLVKDSGAPVIGAVNASFFVMPAGNVLGLALDEKRLWSKKLGNLKIGSAGVFGIKKGAPFLETRKQFVKRHGSVISVKAARQYSFAVQAYPRLLIDGQLQISDRVLDVKRPRTSIGVTADSASDELLLVTIDADGESAQTGMTLYEYAQLIKTAECGVQQKTALNLDGGGSTSFSIPSKEMYHQADRCRHLGNILTIQKR